MKTIRKLALPAVALVALVYLRIFGGMSASESDEFCVQLMSEGKSAEARSWFDEGVQADEFRTIYEYDNEFTRKTVNELYGLGAVEVTASDIDIDPGFGETTDVLIVTLPEDSKSRANLFKYESRLSGFAGLSGETDKGQKYLLLWWD